MGERPTGCSIQSFLSSFFFFYISGKFDRGEFCPPWTSFVLGLRLYHHLYVFLVLLGQDTDGKGMYCIRVSHSSSSLYWFCFRSYFDGISDSHLSGSLQHYELVCLMWNEYEKNAAENADFCVEGFLLFVYACLLLWCEITKFMDLKRTRAFDYQSLSSHWLLTAHTS